MAYSDLTPQQIEILRLLACGNRTSAVAKRLSLSFKFVSEECVVIKEQLGARDVHELVNIAVEHQLI